MQNPLILADATPEGGLLIPITAAAAGGLAGLVLASQAGAACTVEVSADGTTWQAVTPPHTLAVGTLRLTRTDTGNLASVLGLTAEAGEGSGTGGETGGGGTIAALQNGSAVQGLTAAEGGERRYTITLPQGATNLNVTLTGGSGDADLYLRQGTPPVITGGAVQADHLSTNGGNEESVTVAAPTAGIWHVLVRAYSATEGATLTATWQEAGTGGGDTGGGSGAPDPDEWMYVDTFDRATLGSNYEVAQDGPDAPPAPLLVGGHLLFRLPASAVSGSSGNGFGYDEFSYSRATALLAAARWTGRSAHLQVDLAGEAASGVGQQLALAPGARIELRGLSRHLRVEITPEGEVTVGMYNPASNGASKPEYVTGLSLTGTVNGRWTVTLDEPGDRVQVWQGSSALIDAPLPPDYAALMGAGGTVALTAWRYQGVSGRGYTDATLTVDNLAVRSGDGQAV